MTQDVNSKVGYQSLVLLGGADILWAHSTQPTCFLLFVFLT